MIPGSKNPNSTSGSAVRHAISGGLGSVVAAALNAYLGVPEEAAVMAGTAVAAGIGALFRRLLER